MITAIVQFKVPAGVTLAKAAELFRGSAPKYRSLDGLVRKYYLFNPDESVAGGVYLWRDRASAEKAYDAAWRKMIEERYGAKPTVSYFETPVIVDNALGVIEDHAA
jgi:hypothetical protein